MEIDPFAFPGANSPKTRNQDSGTVVTVSATSNSSSNNVLVEPLTPNAALAAATSGVRPDLLGPQGENQQEQQTGEGTAYTHAWKPCYLCGLDTTWPYMMHSDASRATVTHNCMACGEVVCSACSPAGDQLPGDGEC